MQSLMQDEPKDAYDYLPERQQTTKELKQADNKGFDKSKRLLNSRQYQQVLRQGRSYRNPFFVMIILPNTVNTGRLGIIVSKKVSKRAVDRNRLKRLVRESFRSQRCYLLNNDFVIIARSGAAKASNQIVQDTLSKMWEKNIKQKQCN